MHMRCVRTFHRWTELRLIPALLLGVLLSAASSSAQSPPALPSVGAGVQTSYVHTSPEDGDDTDTFPLNSVRLYVSGTAAPKIKFMFNTEYDGDNHIGVLDAAAQFEISPKFNIWAGRFLPAERPRQPVRPVLLASLGRVHRRRPGRLSVRLPRPRQRRRCTGASSTRSRCRAASSTARRRPATSTMIIGAGRVQVDFWDTGGRLLPERHLLRRQEPARHRRRRAGAGRATRRPRTSISCSRRKLPDGGAFTVESRVRQLQPAGRLRRALRHDEGAYVLGSYPLLRPWADRQVRDPRQVRQGELHQGPRRHRPGLQPEDHRGQFNYVIKQFNARVMIFYKDTRFNAVQTELQAGRRRPPDPDVTRRVSAHLVFHRRS